MTNFVLLVRFGLITTMLIIMLHANLFVILYFHDFNVVDLLWFILIISLLIWLWLDYSQSEISLKICMNNSWHALFWISCRYMPIEKGMQLLVTQLKFLWLYIYQYMPKQNALLLYSNWQLQLAYQLKDLLTK